MDGKGVPVISEIGVYSAPALLYPPKITRTPDGKVSISAAESSQKIYFSTDGSVPKADGTAYSGEFDVLDPATIQAIAIDPQSGKSSELARVDFDRAKGSWKPVTADSNAVKTIDEKPQSFWASPNNELILDLGKEESLKGFTYLPMQARYPSGFISGYEFQVSTDGKSWKTVSRGEFSNIQNSPIEQSVRFEAILAKFIKIKALKTTDGEKATFGEVGILTR